MMARPYLSLVFFCCLPAWPQAAPSATGPVNLARETEMLMPPPISGQTYPTLVGGETHSNYMETGVTLSSAFIHNLYAGRASTQVDEMNWQTQPIISFERSTSRSHASFTYDPAFSFYEPHSELNTIDQNLDASLLLRLSPHVNLRAENTFLTTSTTFESGSSSSAGISGSTQLVTPGVVVPYAPQTVERFATEASWQFSSGNMIAGSGMISILEFTKPSAAQGLYNSRTSGGSGAWNHRVTAGQYLGGTIQYAQILASPLNQTEGGHESETETQNALAFYTLYFRPKFSVSLVAGLEHYSVAQSGTQPANAWIPAGAASLGWQGAHSSFAASYSHLVTGGSGLIGAYETNSAGAKGRWQMSRSWAVDAGGDFSLTTNAAPQVIAGSISGGRTLSGTVSIERTLSSNFQILCNYTHLHQTYSDVPVLSANPDSDRITVSLIYRFLRPTSR
jgi:hypothetical protein